MIQARPTHSSQVPREEKMLSILLMKEKYYNHKKQAN
jgi:hypothetical protein